jgi:hypothetical protein
MSQRRSDGRQRLGTAMLVAVNAAFAGGLWLVANGSLPLMPKPTPSTQVISSSTVNPLSEDAIAAVPNASELTATLSRPLFRADRRPASIDKAVAVVPPVRAQVPSAAVAVFPPDLKLVGVVKTTGSASPRVLLRSSEAPRGQLIGVGETVAGWRIISIGADDVIFETGAQRHTLSMFPKASK